MQTLVRSETKGETFYEKLMDGVYSALDACDCFLLGGDTGYDENWRYSGIAFGKAENEAVTRVMKRQCDFDIWITGTCGDSNLSILKNLDIPQFELRFDAVNLISKYALAATDSSGGFCDAIWNQKRVNPGIDFKINLNAIPFAPGVREAAQEKGLPPELTLIGGAGEYELLILAPKENSEQFEKNPAMTRIGSGSPAHSKDGVRFFRNDIPAGEMLEEPPCYRSCGKEDYLKITLDYFNKNFTGTNREQ
jgi:thiamine monophosphate kinase